MPVTTPIGSPSDSSVGPCSMWSSSQPTVSAGLRAHLERERQPLAAGREPLDDGECRQHAEGPVVAAAVGYRVEVRADQEGGRVVAGALVAAEQVAHGVAARLESRLAHPALDGGGRRLERRRREPPGQLPRLLGVLLERVAARHHGVGVHHEPR
jgi:hypothetical protein